MKAIRLILVLLNLLILSITTNAQYSNSTKSIPAVRHKNNSNMPDSLHIIGFIVNPPVRGMCGTYCSGGTIKVRLENKIPGYNFEFIYLVTACLKSDINLNNQINVVATKLMEKETECFYISVSNVFDSQGIPFYKLSEKETTKIQ